MICRWTRINKKIKGISHPGGMAFGFHRTSRVGGRWLTKDERGHKAIIDFFDG